MLVLIWTPFSENVLGKPVSKLTKVMDCAPAGRDADAVVHTMVRFAGVIAHSDNVARPDTAVSTPTGVAGPVK